MKRIVSAVLLLMMLLAFTACNVTEQATQSPSEIPSPSATERIANPVSDFEYEVSQDGTAVTIKKYIGEATDVVIPDTIEGKPVTKIYIMAFGATEIKSVDISDNIIDIDYAAFGHCENLESVRFGENVKNIGEGAFASCTSLKEVYLPKKLESLGDKAFRKCTALETVFIPASLMNFDELGHTMGQFTFEESGIKNIIYEEGTEGIYSNIDVSTFYNCLSLTKVTIPASVEKMERKVFFSCRNLTEIVFEGNAPKFIPETPSGYPEDGIMFGTYNSNIKEHEMVKIYYHPDKEGWDTTPLRQWYTLIPIED